MHTTKYKKMRTFIERFTQEPLRIKYKNTTTLFDRGYLYSYPNITASSNNMFELKRDKFICSGDLLLHPNGECDINKETHVNKQWKKIVSSDTFVVGIALDNTLWGWGSNEYGQLCQDKSVKHTKDIIQIDSNDNWLDVAVGTNHIIATKREQDVYAVYVAGKNKCKQLGIDTGEQASTNVLTQLHKSVQSIEIYAKHDNTGVNIDDTVHIYGSNNHQQISSDNTKTYNTAYDLSLRAIGNGYFIFENRLGSYYSCGLNSTNQLGSNLSSPLIAFEHAHLSKIATNNTFVSIQACKDYVVCIDKYNKIYAWGKCPDGNTYTTPTNIFDNDEWFQVAASDNAFAFLNTEGYSYVMGTIDSKELLENV